jgi:hypothetical protein
VNAASCEAERSWTAGESSLLLKLDKCYVVDGLKVRKLGVIVLLVWKEGSLKLRLRQCIDPGIKRHSHQVCDS